MQAFRAVIEEKFLSHIFAPLQLMDTNYDSRRIFAQIGGILLDPAPCEAKAGQGDRRSNGRCPWFGTATAWDILITLRGARAAISPLSKHLSALHASWLGILPA
jgi:hypothetical protein